VRSTILTSQLPVSRWHEQIGDPTLADGILDRLVHNARRIEMRGDSMRKNRGNSNACSDAWRQPQPLILIDREGRWFFCWAGWQEARRGRSPQLGARIFGAIGAGGGE